MTMTYDPTVDATMIYTRKGKYQETLPFHLEGVDLNIDIDAEGYVLGLEVLGASRLFELIARRGGKLTLPERIADPDTYEVANLFSRLGQQPAVETAEERP